MLAVIGGVVALVVVLSGNEGGDADDITTTDGPTPVTTPPTTTMSPPDPDTTPSTTTTVEPPTDPPPTDSIDLEDVINGVFAPTSFNGTWVSGKLLSIAFLKLSMKRNTNYTLKYSRHILINLLKISMRI